MNEPHPADLLIPFYAAGTLPPEQVTEVERRLADSAEARELLALARAAVDAGADVEQQPVHPLLLTRYAEDPQALDPATRTHVEALLAASPLSRQALACLKATLEAERQAAAVDARPALASHLARVWDALRGSLLHPIPALAYLLLACALLPIWRQRATAPLSVPSVVVVSGSDARRGAADGESAVWIEADGPVLLELRTGLSAEDLDEVQSWSLELHHGQQELWRVEIDSSRLTLTPRGAQLPVVIDGAALEPGEEYTLALRARSAGSPLDGHALFRQRLRRR